MVMVFMYLLYRILGEKSISEDSIHSLFLFLEERRISENLVHFITLAGDLHTENGRHEGLRFLIGLCKDFVRVGGYSQNEDVEVMIALLVYGEGRELKEQGSWGVPPVWLFLL